LGSSFKLFSVVATLASFYLFVPLSLLKPVLVRRPLCFPNKSNAVADYRTPVSSRRSSLWDSLFSCSSSVDSSFCHFGEFILPCFIFPFFTFPLSEELFHVLLSFPLDARLTFSVIMIFFSSFLIRRTDFAFCATRFCPSLSEFGIRRKLRFHLFL